MPTYEYLCTACGHNLDVVQSFTEDPLTTCPECSGALRKVFGAVGIVLKGSGFYKTDSRQAAKSSRNGGSSAEAARGSEAVKTREGGTATGSESKSGGSEATSNGAGSSGEGSKQGDSSGSSESSGSSKNGSTGSTGTKQTAGASSART